MASVGITVHRQNAATAQSNVVDNMSSTTKASKAPNAKSTKVPTTATPSASPSAKPSDKPSLSPSETPSASPSVKPSDMPSPAPSECAGNWKTSGKYCNPACGPGTNPGCITFTKDPSSATTGADIGIFDGFTINLEVRVSKCVIEVYTFPLKDLDVFYTLSGDGDSLFGEYGGSSCTFTYTLP